VEEIRLSQNELYDSSLKRTYIKRGFLLLCVLMSVIFSFEIFYILQEKNKIIEDFHAELKTQSLHLSFSLFEMTEHIDFMNNMFLNPTQKSFQDFFPLLSPLPLLSTHKYYGKIPVFPEKNPKEKRDGLLYLEMKNQKLSKQDAFVTTHLIEQLPQKIALFFKSFHFINSICYISPHVNFFFPWNFFPPRVNPFWVQQAHDLEFSMLKLNSDMGWRPLSFQGSSNDWSLNYVAPHFLDKKLHGFFSVTLKPDYFKKKLKNFSIPFGQIFMLDSRSKKIFYKDKNGFNSEADFLKDDLPLSINQNDILSSPQDKLMYHKITWFRGTWTTVIPLEKTPFKILFICDSWAIAKQQIKKIVLKLLWQTMVVLIILGFNYLLIHRLLTHPLRQLMAHINQERLGLKSKIEKISSPWKVWGLLISAAFQEKRRRINDLEISLQERSLELRKTIENFHKSQKEILLQEKLSTLGTEIKGIAHELKSPLYCLVELSRMSQELLLKILPTKSSEKNLPLLKENLEKICHESEKAHEILHRIFLPTQTEKRKLEALDLGLLAKEYVMISYQGLLEEKDPIPFIIELNIEAEPIPVLCNPQDLSHLFLNLLGKGFEAIKRRFLKEKDAPLKVIPRLTVSIFQDDEKAILSFMDNGLAPISEPEGEFFDPFLSVQEKAKEIQLGLSMSHDIIQRHEGSMKIKIEKNETLFVIHLPLSAPQTPTAKS
jgi:signal transduction histidine kinase